MAMSLSPVSASPYVPDTSSVELIPLERLEDSHLRLAVSYWRARCGDRRHPSREELQPRDIAGVLRNMALVKVLDGGADFEYRIVGDAQVRAYALRLQNRRLSDVAADAPAFGGIVQGLFTHLVQDGAPFAIRGRIGRDIPEANFTDIESVFLPLGASDHVVDHIVIFSSYVMRAVSTYCM